jgi:pyruvate dehydrogenase E1 component
VTSPDRLFRALRARTAATGAAEDAPSWVLDAAFPAERAAPLVTVLDGHPHTLSFLGSVHGVRAAHLGVTDFGRSSDLAGAWAHHRIDADAIVAAALA